MNQCQKPLIRNPEKWIGRYVRHMANWRDFQFGDTNNIYCVCEWTGKLMLIKNDAYYGDYFETKQIAEAAGYDECYYYSAQGLYAMWQNAHSQRKVA